MKGVVCGLFPYGCHRTRFDLIESLYIFTRLVKNRFNHFRRDNVTHNNSPYEQENEIRSGLKPKTPPSGVKGKISVTTTTNSVAINKYFPGLLLKKGLRLRITSTIREAETTDSRNQPVLN